jgi:hypothetical protein
MLNLVVRKIISRLEKTLCPGDGRLVFFSQKSKGIFSLKVLNVSCSDNTVSLQTMLILSTYLVTLTEK